MERQLVALGLQNERVWNHCVGCFTLLYKWKGQAKNRVANGMEREGASGAAIGKN